MLEDEGSKHPLLQPTLADLPMHADPIGERTAMQGVAAEQQQDDQEPVGASSSDRSQAQEQEQHQQPAAEAALPLLLQHDSIRAQLRVAARLLCCSKELAAAVAEHCAGRLDVAPTESQAEQAAPWLQKHARLARSFDLRFIGCDALLALHHGLDDHGEACLAALAAAPHTLMLESLRAYLTETTLPLLEQLPASRLTELELTMDNGGDGLAARLSAALTRLTALRSLVLGRDADETLPLDGMAALTRLTSLRFSGPASDLRHVPPQLLELDADCDGQPLELQHLTAVTALTSTVQEGDVLPPNLCGLLSNQCWSVQPLLPLTQLQQLSLGFFGPVQCTADQLRQLSRLTSLTLDCSNQHPTKEPASAAAWPALALQRLVLKGVMLSAPVCQRLARLSSLSRLGLQMCRLPQPDSAQQLAAALRGLSGLQQLELSRPQAGTAATTRFAAFKEAQEKAAAGVQQLAQAVCSLQQLHELDISGVSQLASIAAASASSLTALTALASLSVACCDVPDMVVASIASQLPGLQSLDCSGNASLTNTALPAIAQLRQLTRLVLSGTQVTDADMHQLSGLTRLVQVEVDPATPADDICHIM